MPDLARLGLALAAELGAMRLGLAGPNEGGWGPVNARRRGRAGASSWKRRTQAAVDLALASPGGEDRGGTEEVWGWVDLGEDGEIRRFPAGSDAKRQRWWTRGRARASMASVP